MSFTEKVRVARAVRQVLSNGKSKAAYVAEFNKSKIVDYPVEGELSSRIINLIHEYDNELSLVSVLGILDIVKDDIKESIK